ncbi:MAG: hypothetical protein MUD14_17925 [Hydrococcus sp. Prado102]|jgi:uncharacterized protein YdeI (BOF family)|nr:hypothetical protein [Hydrococcus sp. Prado102]
MIKRLVNQNNSSHKLWQMKGAIALAVTALILPISSLNAQEASKATNRSNIIAQTDTEQPQQQQQQQQPEQPQESQPDPGSATSDDVTNRPEQFIGQTVTVRGDYLEQVGENAFTITDEQVFVADPILVVNVSGNSLDLPSDDIKVQATGKVREFTLDEVAQEYDLEFDRATYAQYENTPVIIAQSVAPAPEPGQIGENPDQYYDRQIAVPGNIANSYSLNAFTLDDDLLVLHLDSESDYRENGNNDNNNSNGQRVVVTGVLRQFNVEDLESEYDLSSIDENVRRQLEENYADRPVLISDGVYPAVGQDN